MLYLQYSVVPLPEGDQRSCEGLKTGGLAARPVVPGSLAHVLQQCSAAECSVEPVSVIGPARGFSGGPWRGRSLAEKAIRLGQREERDGMDDLRPRSCL